MLTERIIGAFSFRREVYAEVEADMSFTRTAWILVAVISFLNQIGSFASREIINWLVGAVVGTLFSIAAFAVGALVINWVGRAVYKADVTFDELVRTLGLAYVWQLIGVLGVLSAFSTALACLLAPIMVIAAILLVVAWFIAAKEALDLDWVKTIITVILGWLALIIITAIAGVVVGQLGFGGAVLGGLLGS
jgi:hypothetical protein